MPTTPNDPYAALGPMPTVAETMRLFNNTDTALGWALHAVDCNLMGPHEIYPFCRDLKNDDDYARSIALTAWAEEIASRISEANEMRAAQEG